MAAVTASISLMRDAFGAFVADDEDVAGLIFPDSTAMCSLPHFRRRERAGCVEALVSGDLDEHSPRGEVARAG